jgi:hypothetical protein
MRRRAAIFPVKSVPARPGHLTALQLHAVFVPDLFIPWQYRRT